MSERVWLSRPAYFLAHTPYPGRGWSGACGVDLVVGSGDTTEAGEKKRCGACADVIDELEAVHEYYQRQRQPSGGFRL